ncbi:hypothetical protein [Massiliimalia timonensis]|uniref:Uncharacterized protein n=1 Tax=Massiliimalia timonensis TaxID=1987501 RepID=A0A8J6PL33_9FIRM|nr:hypothetical protein [Massiliimalia timonensis]MBC8611645.1 hypothetical protein [Massiliimalia timonensis]MBS7175371.1 hypothetical protein [Clostridiales bacterium]
MPGPKKKGLKAWQIVLIVLGALVVIGGFGTAIGEAFSNLSTIQSLSWQSSEDISLEIGRTEKGWVKVNPKQFKDGDVIFASSDESVAVVQPGTKTSGALWYEIKAVGEEKAEIYARSSDGKTETAFPIIVTVISNEPEPEPSTEPEIGSSAEFIQDISQILSESFDPELVKFDVSFDETTSLMTITMSEDGMANRIVSDLVSEEEWTTIRDGMVDVSTSIQDLGPYYGFPDTSVQISILNDSQEDRVLFSVLDGTILYDVMEEQE